MKEFVLLKRPDGSEIARIPRYKSLKEVPLRCFIDFLVAIRPLIEASNEPESEEAQPEQVSESPLFIIAKAVGGFYGIDLLLALEAEWGGIENADLETGMLMPVYAWIKDLVASHCPELKGGIDASFVYKGESFNIPAWIARVVMGDPVPPALQTIEAVEALNCHWLYNKHVEQEGDSEGSALFTRYLRLLAILSRHPGEELPFEVTARDRFISERTVFFIDIDAATALNVDFFLTSIGGSSEKSKQTIGFLIRQTISWLLTLRLGPKRKRKRSKKIKRYSIA